MSRKIKSLLTLLAISAALAPLAHGQTLYIDRLPVTVLAVTPPTERVSGEPGTMQVVATGCQSTSLADARQRIVDVAVQEWAYFGFSIADETAVRQPGSRNGPTSRGTQRFRRGFSRVNTEEAARLADSIAGYWAITGDGSWILSRQNEVWAGNGVGARWRDPWSAAFISWVMCESGLGDDSIFERAIAHHTYIDQAIRARDGDMADTAYVAYDIGEARIEPGDLLCAARRPTYDSLDQRRRQLGNGIRSHCDIVVKVEAEQQRVLAIGGNVRGSVSLKLLPAVFASGDPDGPEITQVGRGRGEIFAHLKLRSAPVDGDAFRLTPTFQMLEGQPDVLDRLKATLERSVRALSESLLL